MNLRVLRRVAVPIDRAVGGDHSRRATASAFASCGRRSSASAPLPLSTSVNSLMSAMVSCSAKRATAARWASMPRPRSDLGVELRRDSTRPPASWLLRGVQTANHRLQFEHCARTSKSLTGGRYITCVSPAVGWGISCSPPVGHLMFRSKVFRRNGRKSCSVQNRAQCSCPRSIDGGASSSCCYRGRPCRPGRQLFPKTARCAA